MRKSCPQMGQRTFEESFACWHTCINALLSYFCFAEKNQATEKIATKNKLSASDTARTAISTAGIS
jgi:hypothetical protein